VKLVHLFGFVIKKVVTMHGHMNVKSLGRVYALLPNYLGNLALQ